MNTINNFFYPHMKQKMFYRIASPINIRINFMLAMLAFKTSKLEIEVPKWIPSENRLLIWSIIITIIIIMTILYLFYCRLSIFYNLLQKWHQSKISCMWVECILVLRHPSVDRVVVQWHGHANPWRCAGQDANKPVSLSGFLKS